MDAEYVQFDGSFDSFQHLPVYQLRVAVHNLGVYTRDTHSENHVSIYLLLGENRSFHIDMVPRRDSDSTEVVGELLLRGRLYQMSNTVIRHADVDAVGRPAAFVPSAVTNPTSFSRLVGEFVRIALNQSFHYFRFAFTDGHAVGCRYWVLSLMDFFRRSGYLSSYSSFSTPNEVNPSLLTLLAHRWDTQRAPLPQAIFPGLFLGRPALEIDVQEATGLLARADGISVLLLCKVLEPRDETGRLQGVHIADRELERDYSPETLTMATIANLMSFEIGQAYDMMFAPSDYISALVDALNSQYSLARDVLRGIVPLMDLFRQNGDSELEPIIFTRLLVIVTDMCGSGTE